MRDRTGNQTAQPGPATSCPPLAAHKPDECHDHDGHPDDDCEAGLDAYVARLAAAAAGTGSPAMADPGRTDRRHHPDQTPGLAAAAAPVTA
jgi:hypothetical protein